MYVWKDHKRAERTRRPLAPILGGYGIGVPPGRVHDKIVTIIFSEYCVAFVVWAASKLYIYNYNNNNNNKRRRFGGTQRSRLGPITVQRMAGLLTIR